MSIFQPKPLGLGQKARCTTSSSSRYNNSAAATNRNALVGLRRNRPYNTNSRKQLSSNFNFRGKVIPHCGKHVVQQNANHFAPKKNTRGTATITCVARPSVNTLVLGYGDERVDGFGYGMQSSFSSTQGTSVITDLAKLAVRAATTLRLHVSRIPAEAVIVCTAMLWGTSPLVTSYMLSLPGAPSTYEFVAVRYSITTLVLSTIILLPQLISGAVTNISHRINNKAVGSGKLHRHRPVPWGRLALIAAELGAVTAISQLCQVLALSLAPPVRVAFLQQASIAFAPLIAVCLGKKVSGIAWVGCSLVAMAASSLSLAALSASGTETGAASLAAVAGDACALAGALLVAFNTVRTSHHSHKLSGIPPIILAATKVAGVATSAWIMLSCVPGARESLMFIAGNASCGVWLCMAWLACGPGAVANILQFKAQKVMPGHQAQAFLALTPIFAACGSAALTHTAPAGLEIAAGAVMVVGAWLSGRGDNQDGRPLTKPSLPGTLDSFDEFEVPPFVVKNCSRVVKPLANVRFSPIKMTMIKPSQSIAVADDSIGPAPAPNNNEKTLA